MLYLEDFLELIESFPQDLKDRLNEIRDLDSQVQTETDKLDSRADIFFSQCKKQKADWKLENFEIIKKDYLKLLETADDKVHITNQLNDLIDKCLKKLDQEILKFKLELEADHAGITSKLEKTVSTQNQNNEVYNEDVFNSLIDDKSHLYDQIDAYPNIYSPVNLNDSNTFSISFNNQLSINQTNLKSQLSSNLLRTNSLASNISSSASALTPGLLSGNFEFLKRTNKRPHIRTIDSINSNLPTTHHRSRTKKVKIDKYDDELDDEEYYDDETNDGSIGQIGGDDVDSSIASDGGDSSTITNDKHFKEDPSDDPTEEQRYCLCKDVSYGDMILCDNRRCDTQWFHFTCVGLNSAPKGKWFCPACVNARKKRKEKQLNSQNLIFNNNTGQININNHSNSNESKLTPPSSSNDVYNDEFDYKFQVPKVFNKQKQQEQSLSLKLQNDIN